VYCVAGLDLLALDPLAHSSWIARTSRTTALLSPNATVLNMPLFCNFVDKC
jgi:hypothetical protein